MKLKNLQCLFLLQFLTSFATSSLSAKNLTSDIVKDKNSTNNNSTETVVQKLYKRNASQEEKYLLVPPANVKSQIAKISGSSDSKKTAAQ